MEAVLWSAIALTAAFSMGTLYLLVARLDGIATRIDGLSGRIDAQGDSLSSRIDAQGDSLGGRIDALATMMDARFGRIDDRLVHVERRLEAHVGRHAG